jgi:two-component system, LytTR family, response regulator
MKLRVLIADDEPLNRERLREFLRAEPSTEVVAECLDGMEAVNAIHQKSPDLVFLDVKMPELDGFGVLEALNGARLPAIIFVTAHDRYALRAFEAHAVDYLLKPVERDRFQTALRRACQRLQSGSGPQSASSLSHLLASLGTPPQAFGTDDCQVGRPD